MQYKCILFVLRTVIWIYNWLLRIITTSGYLKLYVCNDNDNYSVEIIIWNHEIVYKLLVFERNAGNHIIVQIIWIRDEYLIS